MRQRVQEVYDVNVIVKRPINAGLSQSLGGEFTFSNKVVDWLSFDLGLNLFYYKVEGDTIVSTINQESFTYRGRSPVVGMLAYWLTASQRGRRAKNVGMSMLSVHPSLTVISAPM